MAQPRPKRARPHAKRPRADPNRTATPERRAYLMAAIQEKIALLAAARERQAKVEDEA
jgi:hypothetical protein